MKRPSGSTNRYGGREVFVMQPTAPPVNDHLVELLAFADGCRCASAGRSTVMTEQRDWPQLRVASVAPLIAGAIRRFLADGSLSDLS